MTVQAHFIYLNIAAISAGASFSLKGAKTDTVFSIMSVNSLEQPSLAFCGLHDTHKLLLLLVVGCATVIFCSSFSNAGKKLGLREKGLKI